ncbi:MAG TPA: hypothetical protein VFT72_01560 [Opitutaceae bacterium]|nr:hypothetical protein [Opitutaceae bacterium]
MRRALASLTSLAFAACAPIAHGGTASRAEEVNIWPFFVESGFDDSAAKLRWSAAGPLFFSQPIDPASFNGGDRARGFRPFYLESVNSQAGDTVQEAHFLYPLFSYRRAVDGYRWSVFSLINHYSGKTSKESKTQRGFDLWPFYFSRDTGNPESSYHAVMPLFGEVKQRFGDDRISWFFFPLYGRFEKNGVDTYTTPWPFIKTMRGQGNHGFDLWPLFGTRHKDGVYREQFYLWPLIYRRETDLALPVPTLRAGFLPFYAMSRDADSHSETYLWPFFGYSDRTAPYVYHQTNYAWPFFVQGRGTDRYVNRWGPFYTHSIIKGTEKTWILWPFWRKLDWTDAPIHRTKRQFLYFIYNDETQHSVSNPALPSAHKTHYWPFLTIWDNGAGQKQIQALSPLEVFFPSNETMRLNYTPLFALYRYNRPNPQRTEHSVLWNFITVRRSPQRSEVHVGPLFSRQSARDWKRFTLGNGLVAWQRDAEHRWHFSFFDFKGPSAPPPPTAAPAP